MNELSKAVDSAIEDGMRKYHETMAELRAQLSESEARADQERREADERFSKEHDELTRARAEGAMLREQAGSLQRRLSEMEAVLAEAQTHLSCFAAMVLDGLDKMKLGKLRTATSVRRAQAGEVPADVADKLEDILRRAGPDAGNDIGSTSLPLSFAPPRPRLTRVQDGAGQ